MLGSVVSHILQVQSMAGCLGPIEEVYKGLDKNPKSVWDKPRTSATVECLEWQNPQIGSKPKGSVDSAACVMSDGLRNSDTADSAKMVHSF